MAKKKKGIIKWGIELFMGSDDVDEPKKTRPEELQEAVQMEMALADKKGEAATAAMIAAGNQRKELAKLVVQHKELGNQALLSQKKNDTDKAKKILALQLAIKEKIDIESKNYAKTDVAAQQLIAGAKKTYKSAENASQDLPRKVLQIEINNMIERARRLESDAAAQIDGKRSYKQLADSIDLTTARLMTQNLIKESSELGLDADIENVLKEAEFEEAYKMLEKKAESIGDVIDADVEFIEEGDPVTRARQLLSAPPFGGMISVGGDRYNINKPEKEPVVVRAAEAGDDRDEVDR